jgi:hypothetical protein
MRFQSHRSSCGPASLRTALMARGISRSEDELASLTGCTTEGTGARGILKAAHQIAVEHPHLNPGVIHERRGDIALLRLLAAHRAGMVAILCVDHFNHWVTSFGLLGESTVHVCDPANDELVLHYRPQELVERWGCIEGNKKAVYYAIIL